MTILDLEKIINNENKTFRIFCRSNHNILSGTLNKLRIIRDFKDSNLYSLILEGNEILFTIELIEEDLDIELYVIYKAGLTVYNLKKLDQFELVIYIEK